MQLPTGRDLTGDERSRLDNLYAAYNLTSDNGPADRFAACFVDDGVLDLRFVDRTVTGSEELERYKREDLDARSESGEIRRHLNGSVYAARDDDGTIRVACYYYLLIHRPGSDGDEVLVDGGTYQDVIAAADDGYRFVSRRVSKDLRGTVPPGSL